MKKPIQRIAPPDYKSNMVLAKVASNLSWRELAQRAGVHELSIQAAGPKAREGVRRVTGIDLDFWAARSLEEICLKEIRRATLATFSKDITVNVQRDKFRLARMASGLTYANLARKTELFNAERITRLEKQGGFVPLIALRDLLKFLPVNEMFIRSTVKTTSPQDLCRAEIESARQNNQRRPT